MKNLCEMTVEEVQNLAQTELDRQQGQCANDEWVPKMYSGQLADKDNPGDPDCPFILGKSYLIRTVTMIQTGRVCWIGEREIMLEDAAWIPGTGRFHEALKDPQVLDEVEPSALPCIVGRGAIVDAWPWPHPLPRGVQ